MSNGADQLVEQLTAYQWVAVGLVVVLAVIGLANLAEAIQKLYNIGKDLVAHFKGRRMSDTELRDKSREIAKRLMDVVQSRQASEPTFDFESFHASSSAQIKHSQETQNLYYRDFAGPITNMREEFLKRKMHDKELDRYYEHPTNYIGLRIVAMRLAALAERIRG